VRVLYFIQTYRNLPQISRLVRTIKRSSPQSIVLVSHNKSGFAIGADTFADLSDVHVLHVTNMARGDFSILREYLAGLSWAVESGLPFDWVVNMTGQCYPIRPLPEIEQEMVKGSYHGYMHWFDAFTPAPDNPWGPREAAIRYNYQYHYRRTQRELKPAVRKAIAIPRRIFNNIQPFVKVETSYGLQVGTRRWATPFKTMRLHGGSFFKTLSREAALYLNDYGLQHPDTLQYFANTLLPEEAYPQTVLLHNPAFTFCNDNKYFLEWNGGRLGRPVDLKSADYDAIVQRDAWFARKIDMTIEGRLLDMLDERIFGRESASRKEPIHDTPTQSHLHDQAHHLSGQRAHA
jgi:hypothetical protein